MLFSNYRRIKRLGRHLLGGSSLFRSSVIVAGVIGVVGLAALIYLKKKADEKVERDHAGLGDFTEIRYGNRKTTAVNKKKGSSVRSYENVKLQKEEIKTSGSGIWIASATSKTFHKPDCASVSRISAKNKVELKGSRDSLVKQGYKPCSSCVG